MNDTSNEETRRLYEAMLKTVKFVGTLPLLSVVNDIRAEVPFDRASARTREVFHHLAANLTAEAPKA